MNKLIFWSLIFFCIGSVFELRSQDEFDWFENDRTFDVIYDMREVDFISPEIKEYIVNYIDSVMIPECKLDSTNFVYVDKWYDESSDQLVMYAFNRDPKVELYYLYPAGYLFHGNALIVIDKTLKDLIKYTNKSWYRLNYIYWLAIMPYDPGTWLLPMPEIAEQAIPKVRGITPPKDIASDSWFTPWPSPI